MPVSRLSKAMAFPPVEWAEENGLLAYGGDLSPERLLLAYASGIFPWYSAGEPILWWAPDPRFVLFPNELLVSQSMKKVLRRGTYSVTADTAFAEVIGNCAAVHRPGQPGTWITTEMQAAYIRLHQLGFAHSVEAWADGALQGGLYGLMLGQVFFGESMFARAPNASKAAFITLAQTLVSRGCPVIDCQVYTAHLSSLGARMVSLKQFLDMVHGDLKAHGLKPAPLVLEESRDT